MDALTLRRFIPENIKQTYDWVRDKELQNLFTMRGEPTWETHIEYFQKVLADPAQRIYAIYDEDRHVGNCGLKSIDGNQAELWIYIGKNSDRGKGYGSGVCRELLSEALRAGLSHIYLHVLVSNIPAIRMYERLGFGKVEIDQADRGQWEARHLDILKMEKNLDGQG